ncbi:hypothetical protein [Cytobacillus depressus]|uniref:hypothetical protein n=1 Tax=Cytobacillus depressus TaxID=1602942 RepID=UPI0014794257|nr:hypothetical protein [Cytobacillus depressus]
MSISRLAAAFLEDVNDEDSVIINFFQRILNGMYKMILLFGIPYMAYLLFHLIQQS